jgi:hypothetical protein
MELPEALWWPPIKNLLRSLLRLFPAKQYLSDAAACLGIYVQYIE